MTTKPTQRYAPRDARTLRPAYGATPPRSAGSREAGRPRPTFGTTPPRSSSFGPSRPAPAGRSSAGAFRDRPTRSLRPDQNARYHHSGGSSSWFTGPRHSGTYPYNGRSYRSGHDGGRHPGYGYFPRSHGGRHDGHYRFGSPRPSYSHRGHHASFSFGFGFYNSCLYRPSYYPVYYPAYVPPIIVASPPVYVSYPEYVEAPTYVIERPVIRDEVIEEAPFAEPPPQVGGPEPVEEGSEGGEEVEFVRPRQAPVRVEEPPQSFEPSSGGAIESAPPVFEPDTSPPMVAPASAVRPSGKPAVAPPTAPSEKAGPIEPPAAEPRLPPEELQKMMEEGTRLFGEGRYPDAAKEFARLSEADPNNVDAVLAQAVASFATGDYALSAILIRLGTAMMPEVADSVFDLRDRYGEEKDFEKHVQALEKRVQEHPEEIDAHLVLGFVYHFTGQRPWSAEVFKFVKENSPDDARLAEAFLNAKPLDLGSTDGEPNVPNQSEPTTDAATAQPSDDKP